MRYATITLTKEAMKTKCSLDDCQRDHEAKTYCSMHYQRLVKHGNPLHIHDRTNSAETIKRKSLAQIKRYSDPLERKKTSEIMKVKHNGYKKGHISPLKGKRWLKFSGANSWAWKGGITPENKAARVKFQKLYQPKVFQRDNYTCQVCDQYGGYLQVDHIKAWAEYPRLRFDLDNCRTLCMACHYYVTFKKKIPQGVVWGHNLATIRRIAS